ncbi:hypothetical protein M2272_005894 [Mycobacterium frederiksbergense]|uniref:Uncharacterized protein n=1 Tax=Mycolicibacterium frederiksbergense TaxID=117567 RepID=A0ABT6L8E5_9MYCO|nr:hypothetical protein [Mycolicibacterium frederiksbergense]MDH6199226.1 hypothetical protein [Mycolicibacterium frederiksbergense]
MTDRIETVIAEAFAQHRVERCSASSRDRHEQWWQCIACDFESEHIPLAGVTWEQVQCEVQSVHGAEVALAALKAARIATMELPERGVAGWPVDLDDDDFQVLPVHLVDQQTGEGLTGCRISWGAMELNLFPSHSRALAAALLAAEADHD